MRNHIEKRRDMARSILPSKNREAARSSLARIKRAARRTYKQKLDHAITTSIDHLIEDIDLRTYPDAEIRSTVRHRRNGDKLNHFERWAVSATADIRIEDRLGAMRAMLPGGLIGDHALSHLEWITELNPNPPWRWYWRNDGADRDQRWAALVARVATAVEVALDDGRHADLNRAMKAVATGTPPDHRVVHDVEDIPAFIADVVKVPGWWQALTEFLDLGGQKPGR